MKPIEISEVESLQSYEKLRDKLRPEVMAIKDRRRIGVGNHLTFLFENRDTVRYQILEMIRIERITRAEDIAHEVETYNELIPKTGELSATLLIEYPSVEERDVKLRELLGLEKHIWLVVDGTEPVPIVVDSRQVGTDRLSSVQYVKFRLSPDQVSRWKNGAKIVADHPKYRAERQLTAAEVGELGSDFA